MAHILIIDDDPQIRKMLKVTLKSLGYKVSVAENGNEGLRTYRKDHADLVITDIIMPEKEGIEVIIEFRNLYPDLKIIAITGGGKVAPEKYCRMAEGLGANRAFVKPVDREVLLNAIKELLE